MRRENIVRRANNYRCYSTIKSRGVEFGIQKRFKVLGIGFWVTIAKRYQTDGWASIKIGCIKYNFENIVDWLNKYANA